jgi:hypothetical protein
VVGGGDVWCDVLVGVRGCALRTLTKTTDERRSSATPEQAHFNQNDGSLHSRTTQCRHQLESSGVCCIDRSITAAVVCCIAATATATAARPNVVPHVDQSRLLPLLRSVCGCLFACCCLLLPACLLPARLCYCRRHVPRSVLLLFRNVSAAQPSVVSCRCVAFHRVVVSPCCVAHPKALSVHSGVAAAAAAATHASAEKGSPSTSVPHASACGGSAQAARETQQRERETQRSSGQSKPKLKTKTQDQRQAPACTPTDKHATRTPRQPPTRRKKAPPKRPYSHSPNSLIHTRPLFAPPPCATPHHTRVHHTTPSFVRPRSTTNHHLQHHHCCCCCTTAAQLQHRCLLPQRRHTASLPRHCLLPQRRVPCPAHNCHTVQSFRPAQPRTSSVSPCLQTAVCPTLTTPHSLHAAARPAAQSPCRLGSERPRVVPLLQEGTLSVACRMQGRQPKVY